MTTLHLGGLAVEVIQKDIKNVHLSVYPPSGKVRISAPLRMNLETIRVFAVSKLGWIREQQRKVVGQERESPRDFVNRESHYLWGKRYLLQVVEHDAPPRIEAQHSRITLSVRPGTSRERRAKLVEEWYRDQIREKLPSLLDKWQRTLGVKVDRVYVQRMKTKWGSCSRTANRIRLNTELAKKPIACLEYVVAHELIHLIEATHNERFYELLQGAVPNWELVRATLNRLPLRHEEWHR